VAYADDVTIFVSSVADFSVIEEELLLFERAPGACINPPECTALVVGDGRGQETARGIEYYPSIPILGITFWSIIEQMTEEIRLFERASGACVNPKKSKELAVVVCRAQETVHGIEYYSSLTILGIIIIGGTIEQTTRDTRTRITGNVRVQAVKAYDRDPCLAHRIQYVHNCLLSKLWCTA